MEKEISWKIIAEPEELHTNWKLQRFAQAAKLLEKPNLQTSTNV
jgi:hypothetical protein